VVVLIFALFSVDSLEYRLCSSSGRPIARTEGQSLLAAAQNYLLIALLDMHAVAIADNEERR
jgi:hypothetical protein